MIVDFERIEGDKMHMKCRDCEKIVHYYNMSKHRKSHKVEEVIKKEREKEQKEIDKINNKLKKEALKSVENLINSMRDGIIPKSDEVLEYLTFQQSILND